MNTSVSSICQRCGEAIGRDDIVGNSRLDPLQVVECRHCGSILDIVGHDW